MSIPTPLAWRIQMEIRKFISGQQVKPLPKRL